MKSFAKLIVCIGLTGAVVSGCHKTDDPVSPTAAPTTAARPVDQHLVGTWYERLTTDGIEFESDGTWRPLYVYAMALHDTPLNYYDGYPGGTFMTTPQVECILAHQEYTASGSVTSADTLTYIVAENDSTVTMSLAGNPSVQRIYVRVGIGEIVR